MTSMAFLNFPVLPVKSQIWILSLFSYIRQMSIETYSCNNLNLWQFFCILNILVTSIIHIVKYFSGSTKDIVVCLTDKFTICFQNLTAFVSEDLNFY